ncbi:MAG TPA: hypothetical protein VJT31_03170 [Rugosimonospora sp.]|nr:hypothetical protein [Rugosimonospora sp.]
MTTPGGRGGYAAPHLVWEAVLFVLAVVATAVAVAQGHFFAASGPWPQVALTGFVATGLALSLRTGTPNLAVSAMATLAQLVYVLVVNRNLPPAFAALLAVLAVVVLGLVLAVIVGLTGLPAWAVSLAGIAVGDTVAFARGANVEALHRGLLGPSILDIFAVLFIVGSVAGGVLWLAPGVRSRLSPGEARPAGLDRRLLRAVVGLGGSSLLAGTGGVLLAGYLGSSGFTSDFVALLSTVGAVLLGGASLAGRGGGIAGTALGVYLMSVVGFAAAGHGGPLWLRSLLPSLLAILLGLLAGWLIDRAVAGTTLTDRAAAPP